MKIQLSKEDLVFLHDAWVHLDYSRMRLTEEEYSLAHLNYMDLMKEVKTKYGVPDDATVWQVDWVSGIMMVNL